MSKVTFRYSLRDKKTGYYTRYRTKTVLMELPVNEHGFVVHSLLSQKIKDHIKTFTSEPFQLLRYDFT